MSKPNVIIIMADQLRYDALGNHTPNINLLREESTVFEKAYCASPLCVPGRGAFFTGKYPNMTGSIHNAKIAAERHNGPVKANHTNLYTLMEDEWDSWHVGKMDFRTEEKIEKSPASKTNWLPLEPRYYEYLESLGKKRPGGENFRGIVPELVYGKYTHTSTVSIPRVGCYKEGFEHCYDGFILNDALHAVANRNKSKPFLLNAMFFAPHPPIDIPEPWFSSVKDVELPENVGVWGENQSPLQLYNLTGIMGANKAREDWREIWRVYLGFVSLLDDCVGRLIEELKREGIYENSLILFTSDHGEMLGSHRLWQKMCMYEESIRTPLFIKFPEGEKINVKTVAENVSSIDILPTLCDYFSLKMPVDCSGVSLMPLLSGDRLNRPNLFVQYDGNGSSSNFSRSIIEGDYKLIVDIFKDELFIELYNLADDLQEMINLIFKEDNVQVAESMLASLRSHMKSTGDAQIIPDNAFQHFIDVYSEFKK